MTSKQAKIVMEWELSDTYGIDETKINLSEENVKAWVECLESAYFDAGETDDLRVIYDNGFMFSAGYPYVDDEGRDRFVFMEQWAHGIKKTDFAVEW